MKFVTMSNSENDLDVVFIKNTSINFWNSISQGSSNRTVFLTVLPEFNGLIPNYSFF